MLREEGGVLCSLTGVFAAFVDDHNLFDEAIGGEDLPDHICCDGNGRLGVRLQCHQQHFVDAAVGPCQGLMS